MNTVENQDPNHDADLQQLRLALDHVTVGLSELEQLLLRREAHREPDSLALQDAAGAIALGAQELRRAIAAGGGIPY